MGSNSKTVHEPTTIAPSAPAVPADPTPAGEQEAVISPEAAAEPATDTASAEPPAEASAPDPPPTEENPAQAVPDEPDDELDVLTPVPQAPPEGLATGVPVLVGGEDLADSTATLISYESAGGPREVLLATVDEQAEAKLLEALALSEQKMIAVQATEKIDGRLPLDEAKQLYELTAKAAKSVNHKLSTGVEIPEHTKAYMQQAKDAVAAVLKDPNTTLDEHEMAAIYGNHIANIDKAINKPSSGKVPFVNPYTVSGEVTITKQVPAPDQDAEYGLPTTLRTATRIQASISPAGVSSWDGAARQDANGKEYVIDLGGDYSAIYRPYAANDPAKHEFSLRGQLEIHAPQGAGHGTDLVRRLGQLHLVNRPMTAAEGEWTYLNNNITAQGLASHAGVSKAVADAAHMQELELQEIFHQKAHQAVGLDDAGLHKLARDFQLEAAARCLPKKVRMVREAVAHAKGYPSGMELACSPGYDPTPKTSGGWLTWGRFDVTGNSEQMKQTWSGKRLAHRISSGNVAELFSTGVLASTERRAIMGIPKGKGQSEASDKLSGGANSVFLRVQSSASGPCLVWDDPGPLLARSDYYAYPDDQFGCVNPKSASHSMKQLTRDPAKIAGFGGNNEVMFRHGLDLLGAEAPSRIICGSSSERQKLLALFAERGITHLGGKPVDKVVK